MNDNQKLAFGIEIVSAMKASAYGVSIEEGRIDALNGTDPEHYSQEDGPDWPIRTAKMEKERLHKQAMFVADAAIAFLDHQEIRARNYTHCTIDSGGYGKYIAKVAYSEDTNAWEPTEVSVEGRWIPIGEFDEMPEYNIYSCENYISNQSN